MSAFFPKLDELTCQKINVASLYGSTVIGARKPTTELAFFCLRCSTNRFYVLEHS